MPKEPIPEMFQGLPVLSAAVMKELDRAATQKYGIAVLDLMENAGRAVAKEVQKYLEVQLGKKIGQARVVVCCGRGANGGDGLVAARFLKTAGAAVSVFICPPRREGYAQGEYPEVVKVNADRARAAGLEVAAAGEQSGLRESLQAADAVLDALLGTGASGKPAGAIHHMIQEMMKSKKPILALDVPSGIDPNTGYHTGVYVSATATFTLGFAKRGLLAAHAKKYVGELKVLDIGYPKELQKLK